MSPNKLRQQMTVTPEDQITFKGPYTDVVESTLRLENATEEPMAFKVKTTAPKQYCVRPNSGFIEPNESRVVVVMLQPITSPNVAQESSRHKFLVQTCFVSPEAERNIDDIWRDMTPDKLMDSKLRVVFDPPLLQATSAQPVDRSASNQSAGPTELGNESMTTAAMPKARKTAEDDGEVRRLKDTLKRTEDELNRAKQLAFSSKHKSTTPEGCMAVATWQLAVMAIVALLIGLLVGKLLL